MPTPRVVDLSHYNKVEVGGFTKAAAFGIWGVINKVTESTGYVDETYLQRRQAVKDAGMLWGAYHFVRPASIAAQVDHFLRHANPDDKTLLALDWEVSAVTSGMARDFLERIEKAMGRKAVVYSGNTAMEAFGSRVDPYFGSHRLWLAQYSSRPICQRSWSTAWIWQYSGDGLGPTPHNCPGISIPGGNGIDMNSYIADGDRATFEREWTTDASAADQKPSNPQPTTPSKGVAWMQESLNKLIGARLAVDGDYGPLTRMAVIAFQKANPPLATDGVFGPQSQATLERLLAA
jgi:hypothetical protein